MPRTTNILVRVSDAEKTLIRERAETHGLNVSEYLRRLGLTGAVGAPDPVQVRKLVTGAKASRRAPGDREAIKQQIRREQPGLPERSVAILAGRRLAGK